MSDIQKVKKTTVVNTPKLITFVLHSHRGVSKLKVSESTVGGAIIAHIQSKFPRKDDKTAIFLYITYKENVYPLNREVTAKYLREQYKDPEDGAVHLQLK